jgi:hypothetical protein
MQLVLLPSFLVAAVTEPSSGHFTSFLHCEPPFSTYLSAVTERDSSSISMIPSVGSPAIRARTEPVGFLDALHVIIHAIRSILPGGVNVISTRGDAETMEFVLIHARLSD